MRLWKTDSKGRTRVLDISVAGDNVIQESGLVDGKLIKHIKPCKPKNVGRSNATTAAQQAASEYKSLLVKKLKEGYFNTREEAESTEIIMPMLAKSIDKEEAKIVYPCYVQPKLDGIRGLGSKPQLISRKNTPITTLPHLTKLLQGLDDGEIIDGELYAHGLTFQENVSLIKKNTTGSAAVKYHVYDMVSDLPFIDRYNNLIKIVEDLNNNDIELVPTYKIKNRAELDEYYAIFMQLGYEGAMVRWGEEGYKSNARSSNLLKVKIFKDVDLPIIDIVESDRVPGQGIVVIEFDGHRSKTGSKMSHKERADLWTNRTDYIGELANITYFELTDKGGLRFPVFKGIRIDK
jgi:DNA ligase-1